MSISMKSSLRSFGFFAGFAKDALLEKKDNRLAMAGFEMLIDVGFRGSKGVGLISDDAPTLLRGSLFSFVGEGKMPILIDSDSPLNHSENLPAIPRD